MAGEARSEATERLFLIQFHRVASHAEIYAGPETAPLSTYYGPGDPFNFSSLLLLSRRREFRQGPSGVKDLLDITTVRDL